MGFASPTNHVFVKLVFVGAKRMVSRNSVKTHGLDSIDPSALEIWLVDLFSTPNILKSFRGFSTNIRTFIRENVEHHFSPTT